MNSPFEAMMLLCFGMSWPFSVAKAIRTRAVQGKSPVFMIVVWIGYACGVLHKLLYSLDAIIMLYLLNMILVVVDLSLYYRYRPRGRIARMFAGDLDVSR